MNNENNNVEIEQKEEQLAALKKKNGPIMVIVDAGFLLILCVLLYFIVKLSFSILGILLNKEEWFSVPFFTPLVDVPIFIFLILFLIACIVFLFRARKDIMGRLLNVKSEEKNDNQENGYKMKAKDYLIIIIVVIVGLIVMHFMK